LHEERPEKGQLEPIKLKGVTTLIGLFVDDVDAVMNRAVNAGAGYPSGQLHSLRCGNK
jgi:hypothetical protein